MKLLLDEMYSCLIAEQLRERERDVVAIGERAELRGLPDREVFALAQRDGRAIVTDDLDFAQLEAELRHRGEAHGGVIFTSNKRFPCGQPRTIGSLVNALDRFLSEDAENLVRNSSFIHWLQ